MDGQELLRHLANDMSSGETTDHNYYDVISAMFDLCEALYWIDPNAVPGAWQYNPGCGEPGPSLTDIRCYAYGLYAMIEDENVSPFMMLLDLGVPVTDTIRRGPWGWDYAGWSGDDLTSVRHAEFALIYAGNILVRYADLIRTEGE